MPTELAILAHDDVMDAACGERLTAREAAVIAASSNPRVRRRRLAGRLAAKHLLLQRQAVDSLALAGASHGGDRGAADEPPMGASTRPSSRAAASARRSPQTATPPPPRFVTLDAARITDFAAEHYRELELLPADLPADAPAQPATSSGAPHATLRGRPLLPRVSITHRDGVSCAALAAADEGGRTGGDLALGIDLEHVSPRDPAFYRGNFTDAERGWVESGLRRTDLSREWLYTFLWTVKEAALKAGATAVRSVWAFPTLEVTLPPRLAERLAEARGRALGERFTAFDVVLEHARRATPARVETTSTAEAILSLLTTAVEARP